MQDYLRYDLISPTVIILAVYRIRLSFLTIVCVTGVSACWAATTSCPNAPRVIGPFGAENTPRTAIAVDTEIRSQLPGLRVYIDVLETRLSPSGEQVVVYSTDEDESNPKPKLAFVVSGKVKQVFAAAEISSEGGAFWRYQSGCQYQVAKKSERTSSRVHHGLRRRYFRVCRSDMEGQRVQRRF